MPISVTCPRCQATARVPEAMLGQVVRCPGCLMPFRTPASAPPPAPRADDPAMTPTDEPPVVAAAVGPADDVVIPVVRVRRPATVTAPKKGTDPNAGLRTGLAIGAAVFLVVGVVGAALFVMAVSREGAPTFQRAGLPPQMFPPQWPAERPAPGDPGAGAAEFVTRSRPKAKPLADVGIPDSRGHRASLAGPRRTLPGGFAVTSLQTDEMKDVVGLCWTANGDAFLALSRTGEVRRVEYPSLEETRRLDIGQECDQLTVSGEGLLVTLPRLGEIWVIDAESLAVRRRIGIADLREVVSGPDLAIAYAFVNDDVDGGAPLRIDLTTGVVSAVALFQTADGAGNVPAHSFPSPVLTPDGRFLFTGVGSPLRYRVEDDRLTFEAADLQRRTSGAKTIVSSNGRWLSAGGRIYPADDLNRPSFDLPASATVVGFDPSGRRVFVSSRDQMLAIFDLAGRRGPAAAWPDRAAAARQLLVHPAGAGVLLRTEIGVFRIEVPAP